MPISVSSTTGGPVYGAPFVGPLHHTAAIDVDLSTLSDEEIDAKGYLIPGLPLSRAGALVAALTVSTPGSATPGGGNAGNGVMGAATGRHGAPSETITLTVTGTGATAAFTVTGSKSGYLGTGAVGTLFNSPIISFTLADGSSDFEPGDTFTWTVTGGVNDKVFGVVQEAIKVAADNASATIAALGTIPVVLGTIGMINRDIAEDNLGRSLTAAEVAGFAGTPLVLL